MNGKLQTIIPVWYPLRLQIEDISWFYCWYPEFLVSRYNFWTVNDF
jgi:hypothetical protein